MQSLTAIFQSYQSLSIEKAAIEFRITILSRDHVQKLETKLNKKKNSQKTFYEQIVRMKWILLEHIQRNKKKINASRFIY